MWGVQMVLCNWVVARLGGSFMVLGTFPKVHILTLK
jgi:hypothetical protein